MTSESTPVMYTPSGDLATQISAAMAVTGTPSYVAGSINTREDQ